MFNTITKSEFKAWLKLDMFGNPTRLNQARNLRVVGEVKRDLKSDGREDLLQYV